jgi:SAM-dependent methyltransferase
VPEPSATDQRGVVIDGVWPDHPELVRLYEAENSGRDDHDFYLALIAREGRGGPVRVVDIGCGTGAFAVTAAGLGHEVIGVDPPEPASTSLAIGPGATTSPGCSVRRATCRRRGPMSP